MTATVNNNNESLVEGSKKSIKATVDPKQLSFLMDLLSKNYNYPYKAVLREYVSNAYDSHVKAGQTKAVEVTLPAGKNGYLVVQDYGRGLSAEEIVDQYSVYLSSDKRSENAQIGGFGIGSKSALAVSNNFTIETVKNGLLNIVVVSTKNKEVFYDFTTSDEATDRENGVKIIVPMKVDEQDYYNYPYNLFPVQEVIGGWKESEVKVMNEGFECARIVDDWIELEHGYIDPKLVTFSDHRYNGAQRPHLANVAFVGPVQYNNHVSSKPWSYTNSLPNSVWSHAGVALKLPIDSVTFPSSREVIEINDENNQAILQVAEKMQKDIEEYFDKRVAEADSIDEIVKLRFSALNEKLDKKVYYKDEEILSAYAMLNVNSYGVLDIARTHNNSGNKRIMYADHWVNFEKHNVTYYYANTNGEHNRFNLIVNDTDSSPSVVRKIVKDYRGFGLSSSKVIDEFVKSAENWDAPTVPYYVLTPDDIRPFTRSYAYNVENFSAIRDVVVEARKKAKANGVLKQRVSSGILERKVNVLGFGYNGERTLQNIIENSADRKILITRERDILDDRTTLLSVIKISNDLIIEVKNNISDKTIEKYAETLGALIMPEDYINVELVNFAEKLKTDNDYENIKAYFTGFLNYNSASYLSNYVDEKVTETLRNLNSRKDVEAAQTILNNYYDPIRANLFAENLGVIVVEDSEICAPFLILEPRSNYYENRQNEYIGAKQEIAKKQLAKYINEEFYKFFKI